jgi:hypothetical protein
VILWCDYNKGFVNIRSLMILMCIVTHNISWFTSNFAGVDQSVAESSDASSDSSTSEPLASTSPTSVTGVFTCLEISITGDRFEIQAPVRMLL